MNLCSLFSNAVQEFIYFFIYFFTFLLNNISLDYKSIAVVINDSPVFV